MKKIIKKLKTIKWRIRSKIARHRFGNPALKLKIIGVTGTNGKTTTATLLYKIALGLGYKAGFIGTTNIMVNDEEFKMDRKIPTTPDSITLTKIFSEMVKKDCEYVFMEVSSHAMDQNRVAGINFLGGIFSNLTHDHLDYHKSIENYFLAKKKFFQILPKNAFALSNADDEHGKKMIEGIKAKKYLYGFSGSEDFSGKIIRLDFSGLELSFNNEKVFSKLLGKFNAYNLLAVWGACKLLGFDMVKVNKILETVEAPMGRFDSYMASNGVVVIVDYAHTPDALKNVLSTLQEIKKNDSKIISLVGCGGDKDPLKRRVMGKIGVELSDIAIFTSDNPRSEDPDKIITEMKTDLSMNDLAKVKTISNRREAIIESVKMAKKGDIIICAGKGHETYQEIKGVKYHFNDMEEFKKILT